MKRTKTVLIRMNEEEKQIIKKNAQKKVMSIGTYLRECGLAQKSAEGKKRKPKNQAAINELKRIGNNINQIARVANATGDIDKDRFLAEMEKLDKVIAELKK